MIRIPGIGGHDPDDGMIRIPGIGGHDPDDGMIRIPGISGHDPDDGMIRIPGIGGHDPDGGKIRIPGIGGCAPALALYKLQVGGTVDIPAHLTEGVPQLVHTGHQGEKKQFRNINKSMAINE